MVRIHLPPAASQTNSHPNRRGPRRISRLSAIGISRRPRGPSSTTGQDGRHQARPRQERWLTPGRVARGAEYPAMLIGSALIAPSARAAYMVTLEEQGPASRHLLE